MDRPFPHSWAREAAELARWAIDTGRPETIREAAEEIDKIKEEVAFLLRPMGFENSETFYVTHGWEALLLAFSDLVHALNLVWDPPVHQEAVVTVEDEARVLRATLRLIDYDEQSPVDRYSFDPDFFFEFGWIQFRSDVKNVTGADIERAFGPAIEVRESKVWPFLGPLGPILVWGDYAGLWIGLRRHYGDATDAQIISFFGTWLREAVKRP